MSNPTLTVKGLAIKLGYTEYWIREMARSGKIPAIKRGSMWLFDEQAVKEALIKSNSYPVKKDSAADAKPQKSAANQL